MAVCLDGPVLTDLCTTAPEIARKSPRIKRPKVDLPTDYPRSLNNASFTYRYALLNAGKC